MFIFRMLNFNPMKNLFLFASLLSIGFITSCNDGANKEGNETIVAKDTTVSGLEGTRDQSGQLSTDVKPDTTSGQSEKVRSLGQQADTNKKGK